MAMNFWEAQGRAKRRTTINLIVFMILTLGIATAAEWGLRAFAPDSYNPPLPIFGGIFLLITFGTALFQYSVYKSQGGGYVAEALGARRIGPNSPDFKERQLCNIIEELALAAALPLPRVYVLDAKEINAFAAGLTPEKAAICVTRGSLDLLTRDELQGVIAHEFGHVANGDMRIGLNLAAMLMGFFIVLYLGLRILQGSFFFGGGRSRSEGNGNGKGGGNPIVLAAFIFIIAGAITWFFGSLLKAMVSRDREYLADAMAVQYTRSPEGIANALRKIAAQANVRDMPKDGSAYAHLYLNDTSFLDSLWATHPPLEKRIAILEGKDL